ncbi:MAG: response regulator [Desulfomonilaceae bacterium]
MTSFKVLLVDDEAEFLEILLKRLKKRNLDVIGAASGKEALGILRETDVDVVVLDVRMPDMDGIETLKEIKKIRPSVEVIMLTGHANVEIAIQGMELGAFDYLMKPMDIDELLYKLQDAYKKKWCGKEDGQCLVSESSEKQPDRS